jgi:hypothetical protein
MLSLLTKAKGTPCINKCRTEKQMPALFGSYELRGTGKSSNNEMGSTF